jgi:hypothetical protein
MRRGAWGTRGGHLRYALREDGTEARQRALRCAQREAQQHDDAQEQSLRNE